MSGGGGGNGGGGNGFGGCIGGKGWGGNIDMCVTMQTFQQMNGGGGTGRGGKRGGIASQEMMEVTLRIIKSFCTDIHGEFDDCLYNHICLHTRTMNPDGCASVQKCCVLLKNSAMPNIVYVGRDPAHIIRRSVELPVQKHERFRKQWSRIFDGKTALIPSIQNSHQSRALFQAAQQRVLDIDGTIGGLTHVLSHWSYAKHRHESCADPRGKYACMYVPVALFLGAIAADTRREKPVRERASDALAEMCAADAFQSGLNADYSCRALDFLRLFDVDDHDPSLTWAQKSSYKKAVNTLFTTYSEPN